MRYLARQSGASFTGSDLIADRRAPPPPAAVHRLLGDDRRKASPCRTPAKLVSYCRPRTAAGHCTGDNVDASASSGSRPLSPLRRQLLAAGLGGAGALVLRPRRAAAADEDGISHSAESI